MKGLSSIVRLRQVSTYGWICHALAPIPILWFFVLVSELANSSAFDCASALVLAEAIGDHRAWAVARPSLAYIRDTVQITRGGRHVLDALIFITALDANMIPVSRDPALQAIYGGVETSAPDDLRRPVSINALAQSLRLPFETVRRRVQILSRSGLCVIGPHGVIVPRAAVTSRAYIAEQRARFDRARLLYETLAASISLPRRPAVDAAPPAMTEPLVRAANWAFSEYMLRVCGDLIVLTGGVVNSLVLVELTLANTCALSRNALASWACAPARLGRPVRVAALASSLRLSDETVRRHLHDLAERGYCQRVSGGLVATAPSLAWSRLAALVAANLANIQRLLGRLEGLGVLTAWDASASPCETVVQAP